VTRKRDDGSESEGDGSFLKRLAPGLITGASDDDPSGIGTDSQAGAQLGFGVGWIMPDLPADGRDPGNLRTDRPRHGSWHRWQRLSKFRGPAVRS
jgi:hypothetical protein